MSLIKTTFSLVLVVILAITMALISPGVSFAQDCSNSALEALEKAIDYEKKKDIVNAEFFYKEAIDGILASQEVDILIGAKQGLAKIKLSQGKTQEANKLIEQAEAGEKALAKERHVGGFCGECKKPSGSNGEWSGSGSPRYCASCAGG